jgi:hypothetical protein
LQQEINQTVCQLTELQQLLTISQTDIKNKQLEISGLQEIVHINETELTNRTTELDELDQVLKERQWELEQRVAQVKFQFLYNVSISYSYRNKKGKIHDLNIRIWGCKTSIHNENMHADPIIRVSSRNEFEGMRKKLI